MPKVEDTLGPSSFGFLCSCPPITPAQVCPFPTFPEPWCTECIWPSRQNPYLDFSRGRSSGSRVSVLGSWVKWYSAEINLVQTLVCVFLKKLTTFWNSHDSAKIQNQWEETTGLRPLCESGLQESRFSHSWLSASKFSLPSIIIMSWAGKNCIYKENFRHFFSPGSSQI